MPLVSGEDRQRVIEGNAQKLRELFPNLRPPKFSKKIVKVRKEPKILPSNVRTYSRAGRWRCVLGGSVKPATVNAFIKHLKEDHIFEFATRTLAPLGLALCPFCKEVFCASRGISNHLPSCEKRDTSLAAKLGGCFPRSCWSWWEGEKLWFRATAHNDSPHANFFRIVYPASDEEEESEDFFTHIEKQSDSLE